VCPLDLEYLQRNFHRIGSRDLKKMNRRVSGSTGIGTGNIRNDYNRNYNFFQGTIIQMSIWSIDGVLCGLTTW
jgi:hypothetical protein